MSEPRQAGLRKRREVLFYDNDLLLLGQVIRIDLIIEDSKTKILTPIVPAYQARFIEGYAAAIPKRNFEPRNLTCCFSYQEEKEVTRTVYNPYVPTNPMFLTLIRELLNYNGIESLEYTGQAKDKELEEWL